MMRRSDRAEAVFSDMALTIYAPGDEDPETVWWRAGVNVQTHMVATEACGSLTTTLLGKARVSIHLRSYKVLRITAQGVWLYDDHDGRERFVLRDARKRWAAPTKAEAITSLRARQARRETMLKTQLWHTEVALEALKKEGVTWPGTVSSEP